MSAHEGRGATLGILWDKGTAGTNGANKKRRGLRPGVFLRNGFSGAYACTAGESPFFTSVVRYFFLPRLAQRTIGEAMKMEE